MPRFFFQKVIQKSLLGQSLFFIVSARLKKNSAEIHSESQNFGTCQVLFAKMNNWGILQSQPKKSGPTWARTMDPLIMSQVL